MNSRTTIVRVPTYICNGVAVSESGTIYVTGDADDDLYRFRFGDE